MPELGEQMYCSQQICIPPTFPYLLRQFAKAAIRSQPNDLLKWATTYFRCLSLNIPPPVKPRLEYPVPKDHYGMTPGWLRALLYQMAGNTTVTFKVLWDRWIGACLQHPNLIQILVLGGFEDNMAVPWLRFIGLCAAHLTENLTQTMIVICEILTEEPEGGSATITVETFIDLYQFLARIDASIPQTLKNYYFLDNFLELYQEKIAKDMGAPPEQEREEERSSLTSTEGTLQSEGEEKKEDEGSLVSCPSVTSQDPDNYMKLLMKIRADGGEEYYGMTNEDIAAATFKKGEDAEESREEKENEPVSPKHDAEDASEEGGSQREGEDVIMKPSETPPEKFSNQLVEEAKLELFPSGPDDIASRDTQGSSIQGTSGCDDTQDEKVEKTEDEYLEEDLERLRTMQQELVGEGDEDLEQLKTNILIEGGLTPSELAEPEHLEAKLPEKDIPETEPIKVTETPMSVPTDQVETEVDDRPYEEVYVDAVPGIGAKVPESVIITVVNFMREVAKGQHGMVMPRNIRQFDCPPLEVNHL